MAVSSISLLYLHFKHLLGVILIIKGRGIARGVGTGPLLVSPAPISFLSGVDPATGIIVGKGHPLQGERITGKVLAFDHGRGSTVGSYILYALGRNSNAPAAIINTEAEPIVAVGAIIGNIPMIDRIGLPLSRLKNGVRVTVNGETGEAIYEGELIA
jgi:predicted aconitase with swiveling domain